MTARLRELARVNQYAVAELNNLRDLRVYLTMQADVLARTESIADAIAQSTTYLIATLNSQRKTMPITCLADIAREHRLADQKQEKLQAELDKFERDEQAVAAAGSPRPRPTVLE